jgi:hypothetical protein
MTGVDEVKRMADGVIANHVRCPICGNICDTGAPVLALAYMSFARNAGSRSPDRAYDPNTRMIRGHRECVLPEFLTSLAHLQPASRFSRAAPDPCSTTPAAHSRHDNKPGFLHRLLTRFGATLKRGILGKSTREYMKQFGGSDEYWNQTIAAQRGWPEKQSSKRGEIR